MKKDNQSDNKKKEVKPPLTTAQIAEKFTGSKAGFYCKACSEVTVQKVFGVNDFFVSIACLSCEEKINLIEAQGCSDSSMILIERFSKSVQLFPTEHFEKISSVLAMPISKIDSANMAMRNKNKQDEVE
ncbi:hypothetical protein ACPV5R_18685 [Vibrio astriarenae]